MTSGCILFNKGNKCIPRLIVAIHSLKKHYQGDIAVFLEGEDAESLGKNLKERFGVMPIFDTSPTMSSLIRKIEISPKSPFDNTVYLDADTLTVGKLDELFDAASKFDFVATNFAGWRSDGSKIGGRTRAFKGICSDEYIEKALRYGPAINTGIYAYHKDAKIFVEWLDLARKGDETHRMQIPDEIACQILAPQYNTWVAPSKFNVSVVYDNNCEDKRVIHFHGRKHCLGYPLCRLWVQEFIEALKEDCCEIRKYTDRKYGDRRLHSFLQGNSGPLDMLPAVKEAMGKSESMQPMIKDFPNRQDITVLLPADGGMKLNFVIKEEIGEAVGNIKGAERLFSDVTIVTATDRKYLSHLKVSLPNWIKHKRFDRYPILVYVNGFDDLRCDELSFLWSHPNVTILPWNLPAAANQRENMLSAFVLGTAKDVKTPYWLKVDADAFATDDKELITESMKTDAVLVGHKWHYTKPWGWVAKMDEWAKTIPELKDSPLLFDPKNVDGRRYNHSRIASYVCLHKTEFVRLAAKLAGDRLPIPSHDSYLSMLAMKMNLPIMRHNFKRHSGFSNWTDFEKLKEACARLG